MQYHEVPSSPNSQKESDAQQVIIVDDHPPLRFALKQLVRAMGWEVAGEAGSIADALALTKSTDWTLAVVDIHLEDGDGLDLIRTLRSNGRMEPILVHSAASDASMAMRAFKVGGTGYLSKINDTDELEVALRRISSGMKYVNPKLADHIISALSQDGAEDVNPHDKLSEREYQVMCCLAKGLTNSQIAESLNLSINSISTYRARIMKKLGVKTTIEIVRYALRKKLVSL